jgi:hypothetical protein
MVSGVAKPLSKIRRTPSSFVAPHTPAWVVAGTPSSRTTSNAGNSGNSGSPVTSNAIWKPSMSSPGENRRATNSLNSGLVAHSHGPAWMLPYARTKRPGTLWSASTAASACSIVCSPWDQSTVVVTPASSDSTADSRLPA